MTSSFKADVSARIALRETGAAQFGSTPAVEKVMEFLTSLGAGVTAGNFDLGYMAERTVATGANDDIDLSGVLTTALGDAIAAVELVLICIINRPRDTAAAANTTDLTIGGHPTAAIAGFLSAAGTVGPIKPGGIVLLAATHASGLGAVVAATADMLRVANSAGASNTYQICVLARTA